jgi:hypothetical protein
MFPLNREQIENLNEEDLETLCYLDSEGLFPGINENFAEYKTRLLKIYDDIAHINSEINTKKVICIDNKIKIKAEDQLSEDKYIKPNLELTQKYSFRINWIAAFFHRNVGLLTGAYNLTFESEFSCILISKKFKCKGRWLIYSLQEIITHELCHAARVPIKDKHLEEFFAYSLSTSPIRRELGNCFRNPLDSFLLLLPILLLFLVQSYKIYFFNELNSAFFWILIFVYPLFLVIRNKTAVRIYKKAENYLNKSGVSIQDIPAILFRCNYDEIKKIAGFHSASSESEEWFSERINSEIRWKIISKRFKLR